MKRELSVFFSFKAVILFFLMQGAGFSALGSPRSQPLILNETETAKVYEALSKGEPYIPENNEDPSPLPCRDDVRSSSISDGLRKKAIPNKNNRKPRIRDGSLLYARSAMPYIGRINTCFYPLGRFTCVYCAGVLLTARWFLTAAHCVAMPVRLLSEKAFKVKSIQVTLGDMNKDNTTERGTVIVAGDLENVKVAEGFDKQFRNHDIALVKLASDVEETVGVVQYMKLPGSNAALPEGAAVAYYGWGFYNPEEYLLSSQLRTGSATVVKSEACNAHRSGNQFCTTSKVPVCFGDAGGPVVLQSARDVLVGVISYSTPTCPAGEGQYRHTLVSAYVDWIRSVIGNDQTSDDREQK